MNKFAIMHWKCQGRDILHRFVVILILVCILGYNSVKGQIPTYYLDDYCSRVLDMTMANVKSGRLLLNRPGQTPRFLNCHIMIQAPSNKRLNFKFHFFDIHSSTGCSRNFVRIYEDHKLQFPVTEKLCNVDRVPHRAYITNGEKAAVWLMKDSYVNDEMELVFTAFSFSPCVGGDYQCDNAHCISKNLYCNDEYDNCGDESDICLLQKSTVVGIIIAAVVMVIILAIVFALYMLRRQQKIRREKAPTVIVVSPAKDQGSMSFISEGNSTLPKNLSLLDGRDLELRTIYYSGPHVHSFGYGPLPSPMGSRNSTMTRHGGTLGSNVGEKTHPALHSKPSNISVDTMSRPVKRSKSDLRPPFYFDKDGYFSDSSASQTNSLARLNIEKKDVKKKKKLFGKLRKKKSKKEKEKESQQIKDTNEAIPEMIDKENTLEPELRQEEMTRIQYMDGSPLFNALTNPEIRVKRASDRGETRISKDTPYIDRNRRAGVSNTKNDEDQTDKKIQFGNIPANTSEQSKDAPNQLISRRRASRADQYPLDIQALKLPRTAVAANAVVHNIDGNVPNSTTRGSQEEKDVSSSDNIIMASRNEPTRIQLSQSESSGMKHHSDEEMESYDEEQADYPQTNSQLEELTLNASQDPISPLTAGIMSPTRQMGLSARHQDGSPFLLHKVSPKAVENQLRVHPEDRANVRDHVLSFRSYPSPVHSLERAGLFRNSARNSYRNSARFDDT